MNIPWSAIVSSGVGVVILFFSWSIKSAIIMRIDALSVDMKKLNEQFIAFREEVISDYVKRTDLNCIDNENRDSHAELRKDMMALSLKVNSIETLIAQKPQG